MAQLLDLETCSNSSCESVTGCQAVLQSGKNKGKHCGRPVKEGTNYCGISSHRKLGETSDIEEGEIPITGCQYIFKKGANKGKPCGKKTCSLHNKTKPIEKGFDKEDICGVVMGSGKVCERVNCGYKAHIEKRGGTPKSETLSITFNGKSAKIKVSTLSILEF
jgi:hypothetical protein